MSNDFDEIENNHDYVDLGNDCDYIIDQEDEELDNEYESLLRGVIGQNESARRYNFLTAKTFYFLRTAEFYIKSISDGIPNMKTDTE